MELKNYTQKHFELVASVIASIANSDTRKVLAEDWALRLSKECDKFKSHLFLKACEPKPEAGTVVPLPPELKREKVLHRAGQTLREAGYKNLC
jgi:hypothetical protein